MVRDFIFLKINSPIHLLGVMSALNKLRKIMPLWNEIPVKIKDCFFSSYGY